MRDLHRWIVCGVAGWLSHASGSVIASQDVTQHAGHTGNLGTVHFPTSCAPDVRPSFERSLAQLHSFEFGEATQGFQAVLGADSTCAIAYWGIALAAWGNPFAAGIKPPAQIQRGLQAIERGRSTGSPTPRERGYLDAAAKLFEHADSIDQATRLIAYRDAMQSLAARESGDFEATIFYALSLAITAPPTDKTYASQLKAGAMLEELFAAHPDHPGLAHYIIHAYDVPALAPRALDAARRYAEIAPSAPHALHMPSHTFTRVGDWERSIDANLASAAAARSAGSVSEELHASDYLTYAYLQMGRDADAFRVRDGLAGIQARFDPSATGSAAPPTAGFFAVAAIPARYALERGDWAAAAALETRDSPVPFADAISDFARGLGAARSGQPAVAAAAAAHLQALRDTLAAAHEAYWTEQVSIQLQEISAWIAFAEGRRDEALETLRAAAVREDATEKNAITPGPLAPGRELLGEMLLELGRPAEALTEFETALLHEPNRFRSLDGAARSAAKAADTAKATKYYAALLEVCAKAETPGRPALVEARAWMKNHPAR
jgi:tetratricopeptide (TPR) repeat protein